MKIALTIFPTFTDKSVPLGLACINGALRAAGHSPQVYDFDFGLRVEDGDLYWKIHAYGRGDDPQVVNTLGGTDNELILRTVFTEDAWIGRRRGPEVLDDVARIRAFVDAAVARILANGHDQIWFSTYVSNLWLSMLAARAVRRARPSAKVGFGGPAVFTDEVRRFLILNGVVDYCFVGEGEITAVEFARSGDVVDGVAALVAGEYRYSPRAMVRTLDDLPQPDFDGFPFADRDLKAYLFRGFEGLPVSFSRGCVEKCAFCAERAIWHRLRLRSHASIVAQLRTYRDRYGISLFYNCDSLVNFSVKWLEGLCDAIAEADLDCAFSFAFIEGRRLPARLAEKMSRAGFTRVFIGAEHGSQRMLDRMRKGTQAQEIEQVVCDAVIAGLSVRVGTIVNFPGETTGDLLEEIAMFKRIDDTLLARGVDADLLPQRTLADRFRLDPGTDMHANPDDYGLVLSGMDTPIDAELSGLASILLRWDYAAPQDIEFHAYVSGRFGNQSERWRVPAVQAMRMARCLRDFLSDGDAFELVPGARLIPLHDGSGSMCTATRSAPLNSMTFDIVSMLAAGLSLREIRTRAEGRYRIDPGALRKLAALLLLDQWIFPRSVSPSRAPARADAPEDGARLLIEHATGRRVTSESSRADHSWQGPTF